MSNKEYVICDKTDLVAVADAIREKTGSTDGLTVSGLADAVRGAEVNLDAEITEQENVIALIQTALEGKAAGGSGGGVTVPELITVTFETAISNDSGSTRYPINISYLTVDENNTLCRKTVSGLSGSFSFVPNTFLDLWADVVELENAWGAPEEYYPSIDKINEEPPYVSSGGSDHSMCAYNTVMLSNSDHIIIAIS